LPFHKPWNSIHFQWIATPRRPWASDRLIPALAAHLKTCPEVDIELQPNDRVVDLVEDGFDMVSATANCPAVAWWAACAPLRRTCEANGTPRIPTGLQCNAID